MFLQRPILGGAENAVEHDLHSCAWGECNNPAEGLSNDQYSRVPDQQTL
jgi:hypothetical protein